ncbi:MAG: hypothetical protein JXA33_03475 [Anaerolineae bacterium]|nr:hypothetical protein [Anaerolineae bacterium]
MPKITKRQITLFGRNVSLLASVIALCSCCLITCCVLILVLPTPSTDNSVIPTSITSYKATNTPMPTHRQVEMPTSTRTTEVIPTIQVEETATQINTATPTVIPTLTQTPTPAYYHIPREFWGQEFLLIDKCALSGDSCGRLPDELQIQVGETAFTNVDNAQIELTLQDVSYSVDEKWRKFTTTFEFQNPSDQTFTLTTEEFFDAWGNYENWRGAIVVLNTEANFEISPGLTKLALEWTTNAYNNLIVFLTINSIMDRRSVILDENSVIYRIEFPAVPTKTPTPTRTPIN